ncbi:VWA domain-containing protein [Shewanella sp.]|uniref:VWA domain-containing protein n=1 Tax=Shewanella sp. TaxID=50422 RepID=UPI003A975DFA
MDYSLKQRWRLVLGRYAEALDNQLTPPQQQQDKVLNGLFQLGLEQRGFHLSGGLGASELPIIEWLDSAEKLFPKSVNDTLQHQALERFNVRELLQEPKVLANISPSMGLLKQLMSINAHTNPKLQQQVREIISKVVAELFKQLQPRFNNKLSGRLNRQAHSPQKRLANLDWHTSIRKNLKHFDGERVRFERIYFHSRQQPQLPWHVILCIDQSGSMSASMIYSAAIAGILKRLPTVKLSLVVFDTQVVDLSEQADDPVEVLLATQLGGGTLIAKAWQYCQQLVETPARTVIATVSDFAEGGPERAMYQQAKQLIDSGVKMLGMTALSSESVPFYDSNATAQLNSLNMQIASLTPDHFANWLAQTMGLQK